MYYLAQFCEIFHLVSVFTLGGQVKDLNCLICPDRRSTPPRKSGTEIGI